MTSRPQDDPQRHAALREGSLGVARRAPRELYDAGPPQPATQRVGGEALRGGPTTDRAPTEPAFGGEFEQRAAGPRGEGQAGQFGSDQSLREQLCQRIADDPRLAGTKVELVVDEQVLTLSGTVPDPMTRDLLLEQARGLGLSAVRDQLSVERPAPNAGRRG